MHPGKVPLDEAIMMGEGMFERRHEADPRDKLMLIAI